MSTTLTTPISAQDLAGIRVGETVRLRTSAGGVRVVGPTQEPVVLSHDFARHLFLRRQ